MFWTSKKYHLEDMSLRELIVAYIQYPAIQAYFAIACAGIAYVGIQNAWSALLLVAGFVVAIVYPLVWYLLHRFILHGRFLYKSPYFAKTWKRIHYDHHRDPNDLRVLFGALITTLPTVALFSIPIGWLMAGLEGAVAGMVSGVLVTMFYEFCHCIQHLHYTPKSAFLRDIKRLHLLHHFRNETGNYGITNYFWDKLFGTYYDKHNNKMKSPSVFNLGYDDQEARLYPWVANLNQPTD